MRTIASHVGSVMTEGAPGWVGRGRRKVWFAVGIGFLAEGEGSREVEWFGRTASIGNMRMGSMAGSLGRGRLIDAEGGLADGRENWKASR
ncbi:uncharacterized protein A4U43_C07F33040 [Asparagus officinalis]|uniref:Uncharacterized protein n=1 Tax=Asparagus officinalis TaxID=4686 RepID=A0A5P1EGM6_ASPOF|nr:uncharacterized protein A4U43_C07F33040 [Asparagus officinalis]